MARWQRFVLAYVAMAIIAVGTELIPPRPTTAGGWVRALLPYVFMVIWVEYRSRQRAKDKLSEVDQ